MSIQRIKVNNFKSFKELDIEIGDFNVLVGRNASGKSNFVQLFKFLRDIVLYGLPNAISMQGGINYLRNSSLKKTDKTTSIEIFGKTKFYNKLHLKDKDSYLVFESKNFHYILSIKYPDRGENFSIVKDQMKLEGEYHLERRKQGRKEVEKEILGNGNLLIKSGNNEIDFHLQLKKSALDKIGVENVSDTAVLRSAITVSGEINRIPPKTTIIQLPILYPPIKDIFGDIAVYDFDPRLPKKAIPISGKMQLEEDGSNLATVIKNLDANQKRLLTNHMRSLLPFINNLKVDNLADKSLIFKISEIYSKDIYMPASLISDGTIDITALLVALFFEENNSTSYYKVQPLTVIEEPERNIHPYLADRIVKLAKEASEKKQIILTTHSPQIVKAAEIENLLLISRDKNGFSVITKPKESENVKHFLENEIGLDNLFLKDLLVGKK